MNIITHVTTIATLPTISPTYTTLIESATFATSSNSPATPRRVYDIYQSVMSGRSRTMKLTIVRQRDKLEVIFKVRIILDEQYSYM